LTDTEIVVAGSIPGLFGVAVILIVIAGFVAGRVRPADRARWAGTPAEDVWRALVARQVLLTPLWFAGAAGWALWAAGGFEPALAALALAAALFARGTEQCWRCARQLRRGWAAEQDSTLGARARALAAGEDAPPGR